MRSKWIVLPMAMLACGVATAADQVNCQQIGQKIVVTATDNGTTYAVNGSAREIAPSKGWQDGKEHFEPGELMSLLQRGVSSCSANGSASIEPPRPVAGPTTPTSQVAAPVQAAGKLSREQMSADGFIKAASSGDLETIKQYVASGFNVNTLGGGVPSLGIKGSPAIQSAAAAKKCAVVDYLLSVGAKADRRELKYGFTPIGSAAQAGATDCVRSLIAKGARVDVPDEQGGDTPLIKAAYGGYLEVSKLLVEGGASLKIKNKDGDTPYRAAVSMGNNQVAQYLKSKGGN